MPRLLHKLDFKSIIFNICYFLQFYLSTVCCNVFIVSIKISMAYQNQIQALFFGGEENLPAFLARHTIPVLGIVVDPCAALLVIIVTVLLCTGIKEVLFILLT